MDWPEIWDRLVSLLYPCRCIFCGEVVAYDDLWCGKCSYTKLGPVDCELAHRFSGAIAAVEYSGDVRKAIWSIKERIDKRALQFFAEEMERAMREHWSGVAFEVIVPVPSSTSKMKERGFNQAEQLAGLLSRYTGIPMDTGALLRREATQVQHDLSRSQRRVNAQRSYDLGQPAGTVGKTTLLVDDVFTTGSTVTACSDKLLEAGAKSVYVITATMTSHRGATKDRQ